MVFCAPAVLELVTTPNGAKPRGWSTTTTDTEHTPLVDVEVPRDVAQRAARMADEHNIAMEDALARLTAFDYPADVVPKPAGDTLSNSGP